LGIDRITSADLLHHLLRLNVVFDYFFFSATYIRVLPETEEEAQSTWQEQKHWTLTASST
jgi:hypothetical protein